MHFFWRYALEPARRGQTHEMKNNKYRNISKLEQLLRINFATNKKYRYQIMFMKLKIIYEAMNIFNIYCCSQFLTFQRMQP